MDQDSSFQSGQFKKFIQLVEEHQHDSFGIYAPVRSQIQQSNIFQETDHVITSGSLINTKLFPAIGYFMEELFIDMVDIEFCIRKNQKGYKIMQFPQFTSTINWDIAQKTNGVSWSTTTRPYTPITSSVTGMPYVKCTPFLFTHKQGGKRLFPYTGTIFFFRIILFEKTNWLN